MRKERMCGEAQGNVLGGEGEEAVVVLVALVDAFEEDGLGGMMALRISCTMRGGPRISELPCSLVRSNPMYRLGMGHAPNR